MRARTAALSALRARPLAAALLLVGPVGLAGCGVRLGDLQPPADRKIVRHVDIVGNDALSDADISDKLFTRPERLDPAADKTLLDPYQLEVDARRIVSIYQARGYFQAEVLGWRVIDRDPYTVDVEFKVAEGAPTRVSFIARTAPEVNAAKPVDDQGRALVAFREQLADLIALEVGDVWREEAHTRSKEQLTRALYDLGFVYAQVVGDVLISRGERTARVAYYIVPGPLTKVKRVVVVGNKDIAEARIRRRVDLGPGDVVTPQAVRRVERQVGELGVFSAVRVEILRKSASELLGDQRPTVDALRGLAWPPEVELRLVVQESAMSDFQFGAGLSLDSERLSLFTGRPRYLNRNVFGLLDTLDIRLDPAAVLLLTDSKWRFGFDSEIAYVQPSFFEEYTNLTLRTGYEYVIQDALSGHRFRIGPGFARSFFDGRLAGKVGYTFQFDYFPDLACGAECDAAATGGTLDLRGLEIREQYLTATLSAGLAFDLRDSVLEPRSGLYAAFDIAFSHPYLGSDFTYVRMVGDLRLYATPWSFLTLAGRIKIGGTIPIADSQTPLPARFTAGGANDFRGQSADHLGPALCRVGSVLVPGDAEGGCDSLGAGADHFPVGGNLMALASVEARWYLTSVFGLATFLDIGQVWADRSDYDVTTLQYAPGGGLRLFTPIGAIRADLAYNLTDANTVFHMSLGQAF